MPLYEISAPNGKRYRIEGPPDASDEDVARAVIAQFPEAAGPAPKQSAFRQLADIPLGVARGAASGVRMIADAFGAGSETAKTIKGVEDYLGGLLSAQAQNDQKKISQIMQEAEDKGVLDNLKAAVKAFSIAPVDMLSNALGTAAPAIVAGLGAKVLGPAAAIASGIGVGGTMGAGVTKGTIYEETKRAMLDAGTPPEQAEARAQLAQSYGGKNLDLILSGAALGGLAATTGVERTILRPVAQNILKKSAAGTTQASVRPSILGTAAAEALPEAAQGAQERLAQNIALQREGFDVPTMRGVVGAGALEGIVGGGLGAGVGALAGREPAPQPAPQAQPTAAAPQAPSEAPLAPIPTTAQQPLFASERPPAAPPLEGMTPSGQFMEAPRSVLGAESELAVDEATAQLEMQQAELQRTKGILEREVARAPTAAEKVTLQYQLREIDTQLNQIQKQLRQLGVTEPTKRERAGLARMQPEFDFTTPEPQPPVFPPAPEIPTPPEPEPFKITDQKLTELGFSKTSKKARDALRGLDLTKATDLERFDEITQDLSGKVKFNPDAVGAVIQEAQEALTAQKTRGVQPQLLGEQALPDQTAIDLMFAQQRRNEGLPLTDRQKFLLRNQPTPEIITPTAPVAQPLEVVTEPERRPGGQFLTPTDIPKPLQEPVAAVQPEEAQKRRRSKSMPTRQMGLDFEGAPDDTGQAARGAGVLAPVSPEGTGRGPIAGAERADVAGTERAAGEPVEREGAEQPALTRFEFITKSAKEDDPAWPVRDRALFHMFNPNGLVAAKRAMDEQVTSLVDEGLAKSGAIIAYGSLNNFSVDSFTKKVESAISGKGARFTRRALSIDLEGIKYAIDSARKFVEDTRSATAPTIDKPTARKMLKEQGVPTPEINRIVKSYDEPTGFAAAEFKEAFDRGDFLKLKGPQVGAALPEAVTARLQARDLKGALRTLSEAGSTPIIRTIARKLLPAIRKTNIVNQAAPGGSPAAYDRATDTIYLDPSVYSEHALLHEATHVAIAHVLDNKLNPLTQKLQKLFDSLAQDIKNTYGATNLQEFAAEAMSNPEFQAQLRGQPKNWFGRFVDAIRGFLGLSKAKQVEKTLDQILEIAPMEGRGGDSGLLGMNFEQKSGYSFDPSAYRPSVVSWAKERFGDMVAPNGKPAWQNFVRWFGDSKVVDAEGRPLVVYTGTSKDLDFVSFRIPKNGAWFTTDPDAASMYAKDNDSMGYRSEGWNLVPINTASRVIPSFLNISKPYKLTDAALAQINKENYKRAQAQLFDALRAKGYDGVDLGGGVFAAIGKPAQIKSAIGNVGTFDPTKPQILRLDTAAPQSFEGNIKKIVADTPQPQAVAARAFDKVMNALDSAYPAQEARRKAMQAEGRTANEIAIALGGFAQAGHLGAAAAQGAKIGGMKYDPAVGNFVAQASKFSFDEINKAKEGMSARYGLSSQEVKKMVDDWLEAERLLGMYRERDEKLNTAARLEQDSQRLLDTPAKRGSNDERINKQRAAEKRKEAKKLRDTWEEMPFHMSREEAQRDFDMIKQYPELREIRTLVNGIRRWTNAFQVEMGTASKERVESWLENAEWIPFKREFDPDELASMTQFVPYKMGIQASVKNPKYRGSTRPVEPVLENFEKWVTFALRMGMREGFTKAAVAEAIRHGQAKPDNTKGAPGTENRRVRYYVDGQPRYALFDDPAIAGFYNSNVVPPKVSKLLSWFNSLFRKSIVGLPTFALKQLIVDSVDAIQKSGLPPRYAMSIPIKAAKEFSRLTLRGTTETYQKLMDRGFAGPFADIGAVRSEELSYLASGVKDETKRNALMRLLHKAELLGMRTAMHSDNAIRAALYQASQEAGMSEAQSYNLAADYINFRRQVNSDLLRMFVAYVPFSGAAMAAVRSSLMALSGKGLTPQERNQALKNYAANMALLVTIRVLLTMANEEDEAYKNMSPEQRARQLTIPGTGGLGIPMRVSIESIFPIMAELMTNQATSNAVDATQLKRVLVGLGMEALAPVPMPMPAPIKTAFEEASNYNFFTGENIVGYGLSKQEAWMQYGASTSSLARGIGELLNEAGLGNTPFASPARIDHVIRGLLGSVGSGMLLLSNFVAGKVGNRPEMTTNEILTSIPGFTMPAAREFNLAARNDFYDLAERMDKVASTANALLEKGRIEEYRDYVEKNATKIGMDKAINKIMPQLRKLRDAIDLVRESDMPDKDEKLRQLRQMEMNFIRSLNVPELRKMAGL